MSRPALTVLAEREIPIGDIAADPEQPRSVFDPDSIRELRDDIAVRGLITPIQVVPLDGAAAPPRYRLVCGERRLRAFSLGHAEDPGDPRFAAIRAEILDPDQPRYVLAAAQLGENIHRQGLCAADFARGLRRIHGEMAAERAERDARAEGVLPAAYDRNASLAERTRALRAALDQAGLPWPEPTWGEVFDFAGLGEAERRRARQLLGLEDPVLQECQRLNLPSTTAAHLAVIPDEASRLSLLRAAEATGDPEAITSRAIAHAARLLAANRSLAPEEAVARTLSARRTLQAARRLAAEPGARFSLPRPLCPREALDEAVHHLERVATLCETHALDTFGAGSLRLLLERVRAAIDGAEAAWKRAQEREVP